MDLFMLAAPWFLSAYMVVLALHTLQHYYEQRHDIRMLRRQMVLLREHEAKLIALANELLDRYEDRAYRERYRSPLAPVKDVISDEG